MEIAETFSFDDSFNELFYDLVDDLLESLLSDFEFEAKKELIKEGYLSAPTAGTDPDSVVDWFARARYLLATGAKEAEGEVVILSPDTPNKREIIKEIKKSPVLYTDGAKNVYDLNLTIATETIAFTLRDDTE